MQCSNCNRRIKDDDKFCPHCNAKVDKSIIRCPSCWARHKAGTVVCDKCGCNIPKRLLEIKMEEEYTPPTLIDKIRAVSLKKKIAFLAALIILVCTFAVSFAMRNSARKSELSILTGQYIELADESIGEITKIAEHYENDVYNKDWITYIEAAQSLREKYKSDIQNIRKMREPLQRIRNSIRSVGGERESQLANKVYYAYSDCYGYVIGEIGKYPNYLKKYENLVKEYRAAIQALKDETK